MPKVSIDQQSHEQLKLLARAWELSDRAVNAPGATVRVPFYARETAGLFASDAT
jgi:hypothetical protein